MLHFHINYLHVTVKPVNKERRPHQSLDHGTKANIYINETEER